MSIEIEETDYCLDLYYGNLECIWDSLLPSPDVSIIGNDGTIRKVELTFQKIAQYYLYNFAQLVVSLVALPVTFTASVITSLSGEERVQEPSYQVDHHTPEAFGFANSGFQDGAIGTSYDQSSLRGIGIGDWDKILNRDPQLVTKNGAKIGETTHGITLKEGDHVEDLFVNIIDHPQVFAKLLKDLGCSAYRVSLERSVIEPSKGEFSNVAIEKYQAFFQALKNEGVEPWVTLHHFTNPQWFEDLGGFTTEENIDGFVSYSEKMVESLPMIKNWMTFNEPGIRGLEAYVRGEHPPQQEDISTAAQVIRNLLIAHTKAFSAMKEKDADLNIGITHQWLKFLPFSGNPIEKIVAFFYTSLIHSPIFHFFKDGVMHVKIPFMANVQLRYESEETRKVADFLGVQAYGFPRLKIGMNGGVPYPGAADKVNNFVSPFLGLGFTAGSTCEEGGSMQYFGPPSKPSDLVDVLEEAFSIPQERISAIGITETGSDAKRMDFAETEVRLDNEAQAQGFEDIIAVTQKYELECLFLWTLNRHCEWLSGSMPNLGVTKLRNEDNGKISYENTAALTKIQEAFRTMQVELHPELVS